MKLSIAALAIISSLGLSLPAAATDPLRWEPAGYPFLPTLTGRYEPTVCDPFLELATQTFKADGFEIDLQDKAWPALNAEWIFSSAATEHRTTRVYEPDLDSDVGTWTELQKDHTRISSYAADLDGDGSPEILALMSWTWSWRGDTHVLVLFEDAASFDNALKQSTTSDEFADHAAAEIRGAFSSGSVGSRNFYWTWDAPIVVRLNGRLYFLEQGEIYDDDTALSLYEIMDHGRLRAACRINLFVDDRGYSVAPLSGTPVGDLERLLRDISGNEPACGGTLHSQARTLGEGGRVASRIAHRPWAVSAWEPYNDHARVLRGIEHWSWKGLWNYRKSRQLPDAIAAATMSLAEYYENAFGVSAAFAREAAARNVTALVGGFFVFSASYEPALADDIDSRLRMALLAGAAPADIAKLLDQGARIANAYSSTGYGDAIEPSLFYALEHPGLVEFLLSKGADANAAGNFGKTALMHAAQFNLPETAQLLIESGADLNAATGKAVGCGESLIRVTKRTALMYAAAGADRALVQMLLDRGSDPAAEDSERRSAADYVARNEVLSAEEKMETIKLLRRAAGAAKPTAP